MTNLVKNKLLKHLNTLKSFGFEYHENLDLFSNEVKNFSLPNNINDLNKSVSHCYLCELSKSRKNILFGYGNPNSNILFISDEPSSSEDEIGEFYVGKSGELLTNMIEKVLYVKKEEVYITSLVKCRSINGITKPHVESCNDYLLKQIELIKPSLLVVLGEKAYSYLLNNGDDFSQIRGKEISFNGIKLIATFSASFLLRNPSFKKEAYLDMLKVRNFMENIN